MDALRQAQIFLSDVEGPPDSGEEQRQLTATLHALDHAMRLAETVNGEIDYAALRGGPDDVRAGDLCAGAMRNAVSITDEIANSQEIVERTSDGTGGGAAVSSVDEQLAALERNAADLVALRRGHRAATLAAVASGELNAEAAIIRVDTLRSLEALAHHAWRSAAHLLGRGD
jgi:phosphate:Na+ symporter